MKYYINDIIYVHIYIICMYMQYAYVHMSFCDSRSKYLDLV